MRPEAPLPPWRALIQAFGILMRRAPWRMAVAVAIVALLSTLGNMGLNRAAARLAWQASDQAPAQMRAAADRMAAATVRLPPVRRIFSAEKTVAWEGFEAVPEEKLRLQKELEPWGLRTAVRSEGATFVVFRRTESSLEVHAKSVSQAFELVTALQAALKSNEEHRRREVLARDPTYWPAPRVGIAPEQGIWRVEKLAQQLPLAFRLGLVALLSVAVLMMVSVTLGVEWDLRRAASTLEPWALVPQPLWVLYGAQLLMRAVVATALVAALVFPTLMLAPGVPAATVIGVGAAVCWLAFGMACLIGMWGLLSTMMFHHRYGRMMGRLLLSPGAVMAMTLVRVGVVSGLVMGVADLTQGRLGGPVMAGCAIAGALCVGLAVALVPIVQWRLGPRRQGLRRL